MEVALIKRESTGSGPNLYNESETLTKFEIMDGAPVRGTSRPLYLHILTREIGESIPVRLFLGGFDLTPSYKNVHNKFSVKYYLNLVLIDEDDRRYHYTTLIAHTIIRVVALLNTTLVYLLNKAFICAATLRKN